MEIMEGFCLRILSSCGSLSCRQIPWACGGCCESSCYPHYQEPQHEGWVEKAVGICGIPVEVQKSGGEKWP